MAGHGSFHAFFRALLAFVLVMSLCCSSDSAARPIHEPASQRFGLPPFSRGVRGAGFRFPRLPQGPVPPKGPSIGVLPSPPPRPPRFHRSRTESMDHIGSLCCQRARCLRPALRKGSMGRRHRPPRFHRSRT
uniref:Uncharacterized protein n=1 Tax=Ananas comosus var. bracteatus TaxID=296719 RepID=A0A6V7PD18_ANACO|nr:unnamed protein product [Ananas comosus var. bracteatus]